MDLQQHMNNLLAAALATQEARRASYDSKPTMQHNQTTMAPLVQQENTPQAADEKYDVGHYDSGIHDSIMLPVYSGCDGKTTMRAVTRKELSDAIDGLLSHELATISSRISSDRPHSTGATPEPETEQTRKQVNTGMTTFAPARPAAWRDERGPGHIIRHREDNTPATREHAPGLRRDEAPGDFYASQRQQHAASKLQQLGGSAPRKPVQRALPPSFVPPSSVRVPSVIPPQQKRPPIVETEICGVCAQSHGSNDAQTCDFTHRKAQGHTHCSNCEHKKKNGKPKLQCNRAGKVANKSTVNKQQSGAVGASSTNHKADVVTLHKSDRRDSGYGGLPVANVLSERRTYDSPYPQMPAQYGPDFLASQMMGSMFGIQMPVPPMLDRAYGMQTPMHGMPGNAYDMFDGSYGMPSVPSGMSELLYGPTNSYRQPIVHTEPLPYAAWLAGYGMQSASQADVQTHDPLRGPMHPDKRMMNESAAAAHPVGHSAASNRALPSNVRAETSSPDPMELEKLTHKLKSLEGQTQSIVQNTPSLLNGHMKAISAVNREITKLQQRFRSKPSSAMQRTIADARIRVLEDRHRQLLAEMRRAETQNHQELPKLSQRIEATARELAKLRPAANDTDIVSDCDNSHNLLSRRGFPLVKEQMNKDKRIAKLGQKLGSLLVESDRVAKHNPERLPSLRQKIEATEHEISRLEPGAHESGSVDTSVKGRVVVDLTEETTQDHTAIIPELKHFRFKNATGQRTLGSDEVLDLVDDLRVSASMQGTDMSLKDKIGIGNKGVRKLQEKRRLLRDALIKAKVENPAGVPAIQQEVTATEVIYRRVWSEMLQKLDQKLQSLRGGLEKLKNAEQVRGKRKHDERDAGDMEGDLFVLDGNTNGPAQKKPRISTSVPDRTVHEDFIATFAHDPMEKGAPSKTTVMVTNLPVALSRDKLFHMFLAYSPVAATMAPHGIPKHKMNKLAPRNGAKMRRGFGCVTLASEEMQQRACLELDGHDYMDREIGVKAAVERAVMADRNAAIEGETNGQMLYGINSCQEKTAAARSEETKTLHIGNLPYATTELDLGNLFAGFGVERVSLQTEESTLPPSIHGLVDVATSADAQRAVVELNGNVVLDHKVSVQLFGLRAGT
ncbi:hypothetical protein LTR56_003908 [Elasticomyces elasticus]|nr:hypothetical protein LTR56_003908 [Elasticomyces elasticus]KAK3661106.1 hypothetical protein LTR22_007732 [Elasticomyces elasticus]KAK4921112.1 hypothetical protein LTR49_011482 [Elasticomyces elasticus]KAK5748543.1 hypothetical protein LTS12_021387 [Elasticomyces elasticus]